MNQDSKELNVAPCASWLFASCAVALLSACGSGLDSITPVATGTMTLQMNMATMPGAAAAQLALPLFHIAPVLLNEPDDSDSINNNTSARMAPRFQAVPAEFGGLSTRRLTARTLEAIKHMQPVADRSLAADGTATPMATGSVVLTYSPAQIRAAYGLPILPITGTTLTAAQAAQLGAGQTIYLINAMDDPNVAAELAAFNQKFGLPSCTTKSIASNASLPLAAASSATCEFSVVYNTSSGTMTNAAPAYDPGWAPEIALDVQWAHATAPLARIILIEAPDSTLNSLLGSVNLANSMGPGIISMSFGSSEGNWTASVNSAFTVPGMTYLAATGDSGAAVQWPAASPNVLAVGGTTLSYSGTGVRSEVAWSGTGGGTSLYTLAPGYQISSVPGLGTVTHRTVADVSFNADPATGQYVAIITPGSSTVNWVSVGGTSLSTPQWGGIIAVANALRAASAKPALGAPQAILYDQIATVPGTYASEFADITKGSDGSCATCSAKVGYDPLTGLGTPNAGTLLNTLSSATVAANPPVVTSASISGTVGTALSFTISVSAPNPVTYSLSGAPSGMNVSVTGAVTWAKPVAGTYSVTAIVMDTKTGLSGQGIYTVTVSQPQPPGVGSATVTGKPGTPLIFTVSVSDMNPTTYSLSGAPSGMTINAAGVVYWVNPVVGTYAVTVSVKDSKTGLSSQGVYTVKIAIAGPVITSSSITSIAGKPVTGTISFADSAATSLSVSISGAPLGMTFSVSGMTITANWANPGIGSYSMKVMAVDSAGLSAQAVVPVTITAK